jgi:hypothetical protein
MAQWGNVRMTQSLIDEIGKYIETESAREKGFTNVTQFVTTTIREKLAEMTQSHKIILETKKYGYLDLVVQYGEVLCKICDSHVCEHANYARRSPKIGSILKKYGISITKEKPQELESDITSIKKSKK